MEFLVEGERETERKKERGRETEREGERDFRKEINLKNLTCSDRGFFIFCREPVRSDVSTFFIGPTRSISNPPINNCPSFAVPLMSLNWKLRTIIDKSPNKLEQRNMT